MIMSEILFQYMLTEIYLFVSVLIRKNLQNSNGQIYNKGIVKFILNNLC